MNLFKLPFVVVQLFVSFLANISRFALAGIRVVLISLVIFAAIIESGSKDAELDGFNMGTAFQQIKVGFENSYVAKISQSGVSLLRNELNDSYEHLLGIMNEKSQTEDHFTHCSHTGKRIGDRQHC